MKKAKRKAAGKKLGIAVIGCGRVSRGHVMGWKRSGRPVEFLALVDIASKLAEDLKKAEKLSTARVLTDYREVLADPSIDIVDICAYSDLHAEMIEASLAAGKHILTEKPVGYSLEECRRLRWLRRQYPKPLVGVGYSLRYHPTNIAAKRLIDAGAIGRLMYANIVHNHSHRCERIFDRRLGEHVYSDSGGRYIAGSDLTSITHPFDFARYLLGEVADVFAYRQKYGTFAMFRHENDALSQVIGGIAPDGGQSAPYVLCVQGTKGTLFTYRIHSQSEEHRQAYRGHVIINGKKRDFTPAIRDTSHSDISRCQNFFDAIRKGTPLIADMIDAIRTSELLHAVRDSHDHESRIPVHRTEKTG